MNADIFSYEGEGIQCVYDNRNWVMCIKNWKPNNDILNIRYLEVHHATDEQFVLLKGKAVLLAASRKDDAFQIDVIPMEPYKVYHIPQGTWFNTITQNDTKLVYVQDAGTTAENSEYCDMTEAELGEVKEKASACLASFGSET